MFLQTSDTGTEKRWDTPIRDASQWNLSHALYVRILLLVHIGFAKRTGDKPYLAICNGLLAIFVYCIAQALYFTVTDFNNILPIGKLLYGLLQILVILQQLNSKKARGVFIPYILVDTDYAFHLFNAPLQFRPVIDVDVAVKACRMLFLLLVSAEVMVGTYSLCQLRKSFRISARILPFLSRKITTLVNTDDNMEKLFYAFSVRLMVGSIGTPNN